MAEWDYSIDALNVKSAFYEAKVIIYVEGDDDILFWQEVFSRVADAEFEVEVADGSGQLDKHIEEIGTGMLKAIAARDADFLSVLGLTSVNPKVLYTSGYSIENSLYTIDAVAHLARAWGKSMRITVADCERWIFDLAACIAPLVHLDVANALSNAGEPTLGDNCTRFMKGQSSATLCPMKISEQVSLTAATVPKKAVAAARAAVGEDPITILNYLRGHFLASAVLKFISASAKAHGRKINISADSLYAAAMAHFGRSLGHGHPHQDHYLQSAKAAWSAL